MIESPCGAALAEGLRKREPSVWHISCVGQIHDGPTTKRMSCLNLGQNTDIMGYRSQGASVFQRGKVGDDLSRRRRIRVHG